jgi:hypothetical protein
MPLFDFLKRQKAPPPAAPAEAVPPERPGAPFDCCTEDWRIRGRIRVTGRLLDALNAREALDIDDAEWAPLDGSVDFQAVPGLKSVDPYDVLVVFASAATMPGRSQEATAAHRRSKEMYDVILEVPPFHVVGTVHLYPGLDPLTLLDHATNLYVAVTGGIVLHSESRMGPDEPTTILVNRSYITRVHQVEDARRHQAGLAAAAREAAAAAAGVDAGGAQVDALGDVVVDDAQAQAQAPGQAGAPDPASAAAPAPAPDQAPAPALALTAAAPAGAGGPASADDAGAPPPAGDAAP